MCVYCVLSLRIGNVGSLLSQSTFHFHMHKKLKIKKKMSFKKTKQKKYIYSC